MAIAIEKKWEMRNQRIEFDGGVHYVISVIEAAKDLEVFEMPLKHLDISRYNIKGGPVRDFVASMKHVLDADLQYPIIMDQDGWVIDGRHRIARALLDGCETIKAVRFETNPPPAYYGEDQPSDPA